MSSGRVYHPDLAYEDERVALEYQGDRHRTDRGRWQSDLSRRREFEHDGWSVVEITAHDLYVNPGPLITRIRGLLFPRT
jgi:very-short-patch-repair endonuclease